MSRTGHGRVLDTSSVRLVRVEALAVDHDHRLVRPLAQRAAVCDVARALRLGGVGDLREAGGGEAGGVGKGAFEADGGAASSLS